MEPAFDEELYTAGVGGSDYEAPVIRLGYTSYFTPSRVYDFVLPTPERPAGELLLRKESPVLGGYDSADYVATREWATAADGTKVPLSVLRQQVRGPGFHRGRPGLRLRLLRAEHGPGLRHRPAVPAGPRRSCSSSRTSAAAASWAGTGTRTARSCSKKNTFTDFIAATDWLAASGWVDPDRIAAMGGSAGGLLMGAVANLAPEKYAADRGAGAVRGRADHHPGSRAAALRAGVGGMGQPDHGPRGVPVHEVVHPVRERPRRGLPEDRRRDLASTTPACSTWSRPSGCSELRDKTTGAEPIVMKIEMDGGHGGASGRYVQWRERAWDYAFVADSLGATELLPGAGLK